MRIEIGKPILSRNEEQARVNRALLDSRGVFAVNLLAGPGAGKTSVILATADVLAGRFRIGVIEGDIAGDVDTRKMRSRGIPSVQVNTGGICHLDSKMIAKALDALDLRDIDVLFIENVGNLVCPTDFRLGESCSVVVTSVPEGHDKPAKYPGVFQLADAVLLNKIDAVDVFDFNEEEFRASMAELNPRAGIIPVSATKGTGMDEWAAWLAARVEEFRANVEDCR